MYMHAIRLSIKHNNAVCWLQLKKKILSKKVVQLLCCCNSPMNAPVLLRLFFG